MDKTLDDIIQSRPKGIRRNGSRRGSAKAQVLGKATAPTTRARAAPASNGARSTPAAGVSAQPSDKIIVSNLPHDVNEGQVKELFSTTVGPLKYVQLNYNAQGISTGVASVQFSRKGDGTKAFQQYNNRLIDGKKPMKIEIVLDPSKPAPGASLAQRVAPVASSTADAAPARGGGRPRRGRGAGGGGRGGRRNNERPPKSAADLDAEMEDYTASNAPAAAA